MTAHKERVLVCDLGDIDDVGSLSRLEHLPRLIDESELPGLVDTVHPILAEWVVFILKDGSNFHGYCCGVAGYVKDTTPHANVHRLVAHFTREECPGLTQEEWEACELGCTCYARSKTEAMSIVNRIRLEILTHDNWKDGYDTKG